MLGGCQGTTGPPQCLRQALSGREFSYLTIRDQVQATGNASQTSRYFSSLRWSEVDGRDAAEMAVMFPDRLQKLAVPAPPVLTADQIGFNLVQLEAIRSDPYYRGGLLRLP